ncbi:YfhO family protein [Segetibacter aerophilus]|uniref:Membrane protein n=1 Tax=Segetibacter aerophilus TaxID=670293 RepID=A0A512BGA3_9BACT|nr:YfhO family protein [Segetibacter aerophilus]GEO10996.1 membrane protein [Segetibacter aerophilus]
MKNIDWKRVWPHVFAIGIFLVVALFYCKPALQGKVLQQSDITQWKGMSHDIYQYKEQHGEAPLWTNSMFSGMPGYLIAGKTNNDVPYYFAEALSLFLGKPFQFFFLACICFYFLSQVLRVNSWIGVIGSLAYAYATYNPVIIVAGHDTKMMSIALIPGFIASLILIYEKKYWWGAALTAFFTGALISQNHYQITYYGVIIAVIMTIGYSINWIRNREYKHLLLAGAITLFAGVVGALSNAVVLFPNYEYTEATIRGGSELADAKSNIGKKGLNEEYAFDYSMYKSEPFVMLIPRMFGGSSNNLELDESKSKAIEALQAMPQQLGQQLQGNLSFYWGGIGGTQGPPYVGAIICFLAILGFAVLDSKHKWWILVTCILAILMSWGGFFPGFNGFLLKHLPMYNKFRAPSMTIVIPTFLLCMTAILALQKILFGVEDKAVLQKQIKQGFVATAAVFVLLFLIYFNLDYVSNGDTQLLQKIGQIPDPTQKAAFESAARSMLNGLKDDRQHLFLMDIFRSLFFIAIAGAAIWLYQRKVLKPIVVMSVIGLFSFIDVMAIDVNYLKSENYQEKEENEAAFNPTPADQAILQDKTWYRVLDLSNGVGNAFNGGALTAYHHKTIGGYHPAKLSIYQDLIEHQLYKYPNNQNVLDMLNTKYVIENPNATTVPARPTNLGPVWFVKGIRFTDNAKEEMAALDNLNTRDSAVANKSFSNVLKASFTVDPMASIQLVKNENDVVTYKSRSAAEQLAVFSEVFYNIGWNAYVDGKQTPYAKVNYVLRGMMVPAGEHTIVFKFEPKSHAVGWTVTYICSFLMLLLLAGAIFFEVKNTRAKSA